MKRYIRYILVFLLGVSVSEIADLLKPIGKDTLLLKGILDYAWTLEGYGVDPEFDPRGCVVVDVPHSIWQDMDSVMEFRCRHSTTKGDFLSYTGYDRFGRIVDGGQGFEGERK